MKTTKEIEEFIKGKTDHFGCYEMMARELKNMNEAQIISSSITGFKKKKRLFWNNIVWFLLGFLSCGVLISILTM